MKLTFEQITSVITGSARIINTPEGVEVYRFTEPQEGFKLYGENLWDEIKERL